ncbi:unnamed protein product [Trichobilharzia szidati]|nr:unnamed protein product [Trichobilharzia szidati]
MNGINVSILRAITTRQKRLAIRNKQLRHLTNSVGFLDWLVVLDLRSNNLSTLPILPRNLEVINLGNNVFTDIPEAVYELTQLKSISIYNNRLQSIPSLLFEKLVHLEYMNFNHNSIETLCDSISNLVSLKYLSMSHNALKALPDSMCPMLIHLEYLNLGYNQILTLPFNFYLLQRMKTLILHKNFLSRLPETFGLLGSLEILDLAGNNLQLLPSSFVQLKLKECYIEANPFTRNDLFPSTYRENTLTLKEIALRKLSSLGIIRIGENNPWLESIIGVKTWQSAGFCALCKKPFITFWLEGVRFVNLTELMKCKNLPVGKKSSEILYPLRNVFCSYQCLKATDNCYGLAIA